MSATVVDKLIVKLLGEGSDFQRMIKDAASGMKSFEKEAKSSVKRVSKAMEDMTKAAGKSMTKFGKTLTLGVTMPMVAMGAASLKAATDLNANMANVQSLGVAEERVRALRGEVQQLSIDVGKGSADIAGGLYQVVSAFGDTADTVEILAINAKAATAGLATTEDAIALTSSVTKGYGDTSADAVSKVSDLAFTAVRLGQTTFPELAKSIGKVVPLTKSLGVSQEELFAVMATTTGVTGNASEVSTQLRASLQALMSPTADTAKLLKKMGYESGKALIAEKGLHGALKTLTQAAKDSGQPLQKFISSIDGQVLALTLSESQADVYTEKLAEMTTAAGASKAAFEAQTQGINAQGFSMRQTTARIKVLAEKIGNVLIPVINKLLDMVEPWIDKFATLGAENQALIVTLAGVATAAGPVLMVMGKIVTTIGSLVPVITAVGGAILSVVNPLFLIVVAIGAAIGLLRYFSGSWEDTWSIIKNTVDLIVDYFIFGIRVLRRVMVAFAGWLGARFMEFFSIDFVEAIKNGLSIGGKLFSEFANWAWKKFRAVWTGSETGSLQDALNEITGDLERGRTSDNLLATITDIVNEERGVLENLRAGDQVIPERAAANAQQAMQPIQTVVVETKSKATDVMGSIAGDMKELVSIAKEEATKEGLVVEPLGL